MTTLLRAIATLLSRSSYPGYPDYPAVQDVAVCICEYADCSQIASFTSSLTPSPTNYQQHSCSTAALSKGCCLTDDWLSLITSYDGAASAVACADIVGLTKQQQSSILSTQMAHQKALRPYAPPTAATWQSCPILKDAS